MAQGNTKAEITIRKSLQKSEERNCLGRAEDMYVYDSGQV